MIPPSFLDFDATPSPPSAGPPPHRGTFEPKLTRRNLPTLLACFPSFLPMRHYPLHPPDLLPTAVCACAPLSRRSLVIPFRDPLLCTSRADAPSSSFVVAVLSLRDLTLLAFSASMLCCPVAIPVFVLSIAFASAVQIRI
ncbi:hypothetical protein C8R43DRAFT_1142759 [Mycena crocata]|nr:hypothetical protein C8R43DRAFT_1142759 [Mycena crocata]